MTVENQLQPKRREKTTEEALQEATRYLQAGRLAEAEFLYGRICNRSPRDARAWNGFGLAAHKRGEFALARERLEKAAALDSAMAEYHNHLGVACRAAGDTEKAIESYGRALALEPSSATTHGNLGNALRALGKFDAAIASYREAVSLNPDGVHFLINLAGALAMACG